MESLELVVGQNLPFDQIPDDDKLIFLFIKEDINQIVSSLGLAMESYSGALVEKKDGEYKTVWLSLSRRAFDLNAIFLLVKRDGHIIDAAEIGF